MYLMNSITRMLKDTSAVWIGRTDINERYFKTPLEFLPDILTKIGGGSGLKVMVRPDL